MSDDFEDVEVVGEESGNGKGKKPRPKAMLIVMVVVGVFYIWIQFFSHPAPPSKNKSQTSAEKGKKSANSSLGTNTTNNVGISISGPNKNKSVAVLSHDLQQTRSKLDSTQKLIKQLSEQNKKFRVEIHHQFSKENSSIRALMKKQSESAVENNYKQGQKNANNGQLPKISQGSGGKSSKKQPSFDYVSLSNPSNKHATSKSGSGNPISNGIKHLNLGGGSNSNSSNNSSGSSGNTPHSNSSSKKHSSKFVTIHGKRYVKHKIHVAAGSFAKAVLLHGVDCPIGSSLPNSQGGRASSLFKNTPIALAVNGAFKGPDGSVVRGVGKAMVLGVCQGMRTTSRGVIKVEALSVDFHGKQQKININGYVIDGRDNDINVHGKLVSNRLGSVLKSGIASGLAAYSRTLSEGQYTNTISTSGSTSSILTGNAAKAAGMQLFAGPLKALASMEAADAAASVDVVHLKPEVPVYLEVVDPFTVTTYQRAKRTNNEVIH